MDTVKVSGKRQAQSNTERSHPAALHARKSRPPGFPDERLFTGGARGIRTPDLLNIRNFGAKSIEEVKDKLISMGLNLKQ